MIPCNHFQGISLDGNLRFGSGIRGQPSDIRSPEPRAKSNEPASRQRKSSSRQPRAPSHGFTKPRREAVNDEKAQTRALKVATEAATEASPASYEGRSLAPRAPARRGVRQEGRGARGPLAQQDVASFPTHDSTCARACGRGGPAATERRGTGGALLPRASSDLWTARRIRGQEHGRAFEVARRRSQDAPALAPRRKYPELSQAPDQGAALR